MALITRDELRREGRFTPGEFDWDDQIEGELDAYLDDVIARASARLQKDVGDATYATTDATDAALLKEAELHMAMVLCLSRRLNILSSRPEEAPPTEYIDLNTLANLIDWHRRQYDELIAPFETETAEEPGLAWTMTSIGVDETKTDDYSKVRHGNLPTSQHGVD